VGQVSADVTRAYLDEPDEIAAACSYAKRHDLEWTYDRAALTGEVRLRGPATPDGQHEDYLVLVEFEDYRVIPPLWRFVDPRTKAVIGPAAYPLAYPPGRTTVLHTNGVLCAPWNRGAYKAHGGPHDGWNLQNWQTITEYTVAHTVPDMIDRIYRETLASRGRMQPLP
jgi:hypothetical protein